VAEERPQPDGEATHAAAETSGSVPRLRPVPRGRHGGFRKVGRGGMGIGARLDESGGDR